MAGAGGAGGGINAPVQMPGMPGMPGGGFGMGGRGAGMPGGLPGGLPGKDMKMPGMPGMARPEGGGATAEAKETPKAASYLQTGWQPVGEIRTGGGSWALNAAGMVLGPAGAGTASAPGGSKGVVIEAGAGSLPGARVAPGQAVISRAHAIRRSSCRTAARQTLTPCPP